MVFGVIAASSGPGLQLEAVLDRGLDDHRRAAAQADHVRIGYPIGRRDDDLVARIERGEHRVVEDLLAAGRDDRLGRLVVEAVLALELLGDRLAQGNDAGDRRVFGFAAADGGDGRLLDMVGRVEIRLAHRQADDVPALVLEVARLLRHGDGRGRLYAGQDVGQKGHGSSPDGGFRAMRRGP